MIKEIDIDVAWSLNHYDAIADLADAVRALRVEASMLVPALKDRTVWMINSTAKGGGVAEMLPRMVTLLTELGVPTRWAVIGSDRPECHQSSVRETLLQALGGSWAAGKLVGDEQDVLDRI